MTDFIPVPCDSEPSDKLVVTTYEDQGVVEVEIQTVDGDAYVDLTAESIDLLITQLAAAKEMIGE